MKKIIILLIIAIFGTVFIFYFVQKQKKQVENITEPTQDTEQVKSLNIGQEFELKYQTDDGENKRTETWGMSISKVDFPINLLDYSTADNFPLKYSGKLVSVYFNITNKNLEPTVPASIELFLNDDRGRKYSENDNASNSVRIDALKLSDKVLNFGSLTENIQPDLSQKYVMVFEIPETAKGLSIAIDSSESRLDLSMFGAGTITVTPLSGQNVLVNLGI